MELTTNDIITLPKELLAQVKFCKDDVLNNDPVKIRLRNLYLSKAMTIGNLYKSKVKIYFRTVEHERMAVETTIWSADEEYVTVKGGAIPTKSIWALDL